MKRYLVMMFILALSGLVIAESSEISTNFNVGGVEAGKDYVPSVSFWDVYGNYAIGAIVILIVIIVYFKMRSSPVKKTRKRRVKKKK